MPRHGRFPRSEVHKVQWRLHGLTYIVDEARGVVEWEVCEERVLRQDIVVFGNVSAVDCTSVRAPVVDGVYMPKREAATVAVADGPTVDQAEPIPRIGLFDGIVRTQRPVLWQVDAVCVEVEIPASAVAVNRLLRKTERRRHAGNYVRSVIRQGLSKRPLADPGGLHSVLRYVNNGPP